MSTSASILIIDRDPCLRVGAERALRGLGEIRQAATAEEAEAALRQFPASVVVTALTLPDMERQNTLHWLREVSPETVRILMVGDERMRDVSEAVNEGGAFRVFVKPFSSQSLRHAVSEAHAEHLRVKNQHDVLEGTLHGSLEAIAGMLAVVQPAAFGRGARLRRMVTLLGEKVGLENLWELQTAALLSQFGTVALASELVERTCRNQMVTAAERSQILLAIEATLHHVESIPRMVAVCEILRGVDLVGYGEAGPKKPEGAAERVLTLALDFDGLFAQHGSASEALLAMESRIGHYHLPYLDALREIVGVRNAARLIDIPLAEVRVGQFFAADVRSPNDLLLVARGQPVTAPLLFRVRHAWSGFAALMMVRMVEPQDAEEEEEQAGQALAAGEQSPKEETARAA